MKQQTPSQQVHSALSDGWMHGGSFISSILAGALLGYLADRWLGTDPWLVSVGIILGSYSGFMKMWQYSKSSQDITRDN